jgi:YVTN family beta-propeller protein
MRNSSSRTQIGSGFMTPLLLLALGTAAQGGDGGLYAPVTRIRQPIAIVPVAGGQTVLVANGRSGSISVIDAASRRVVAEHDLGRGLSDLALISGGRRLLALDRLASELLLIEYQGATFRALDRVKVSSDPVRLAVAADGSYCAVASRWSRRLTFVELTRDNLAAARARLTVAREVDLPICPRELAICDDGSKVVVADAFGGRLAVIDSNRQAIDSVRALPAHNIRGLAFAPDGKTLVIAHQSLDRSAQASFDDVHWGLLVRNQLRVVRTDALLKSGLDAALLDESRLYDLGDVGYAAGDPSAVVFDLRGNLIVALAGVNEIAIMASPGQGPRRIVVGSRPSAMALSADGSVVYVADSLDDSVSIVEIKTGRRPTTISLGPRPEPTAVDRGERLFYSAKISHDGWMSCHSCHTDGHTNNLSSDTLGDGSFGAPKRIPSLIGVGATGPWTWLGSIERLEDQVKKSIMTTMQGTKPSDSQVADLTAYLGSLSSRSAGVTANPPDHSAAVERGHEVFRAQKCATCHVPPEYTSPEHYDVGLTDEVGNREFNPPSLCGISRRDTFLHDGRARSLFEVFQKERHPRNIALTPREIADLVAFLKTL